MKWISIVVACFLFSAKTSASTGFYFLSDNFVRSDSFSLPVMLNDFEGAYTTGERLYASSWNELGYRYNAFKLGFIARSEYGGSFSNDTSEFAGKLINKEDLDIGRKYQLDFEAYGFIATGLRASYLLTREDFSLEVGGSLLKASHLMDANISGSATAVGEKDYDFQAHFDYYAYTDPIFEWDVEAPEAKGWSIDIALEYTFSDALLLKLWVRDLFGHLYWEKAPYTNANGQSGNKTYDENGYVEWNPAFSGKQIYTSYDQKLKPSGFLKMSYQLNSSFSVLAGSRYHFDEVLPFIGAGYRMQATGFEATVYPTTQALGIQYFYQAFIIGVQADDIALDKMTHIAFSLAYNY
ncbi:hypothetical protein LRP50_22360 [Enterovibrio sp. ZSDZ42]|uniref:Porin domain-containing protein n=1 Tax=Enterovibrio gelatinilyticus TaxID=2899819 RepID=A0ABT5R7P7_9GAMM|nr:hypothetical protein [Enterovibrio sp. ZSDZ42]MDD1795865.1 hypothetical protein [Enterovibrio sp. ZSDZ42]